QEHERKHLSGQMGRLLSTAQLSNVMKSLVWNSIVFLYRWTIEHHRFVRESTVKISVIELMSLKRVSLRHHSTTIAVLLLFLTKKSWRTKAKSIKYNSFVQNCLRR